MEKQDIFRLDTPERTPPPPDSFLRDPKEVERWISGLPMANIGETSRQIFKTLVELNRVEIPSLPRIKTTELFRVPIGYITRNLKKYYYDNAFPDEILYRRRRFTGHDLLSHDPGPFRLYLDRYEHGTDPLRRLRI